MLDRWGSHLRLARRRTFDSKARGAAHPRPPSEFVTPYLVTVGMSCIRKIFWSVWNPLVRMRLREPRARNRSSVNCWNRCSSTRSSYHTFKMVNPEPTILFCRRASRPAASMEWNSFPWYSRPTRCRVNPMSTRRLPTGVATDGSSRWDRDLDRPSWWAARQAWPGRSP